MPISEMVLDMREALVSVAIARQEADEWEHPDFDWQMLARRMESIARAVLDEIDPVIRLQQRMDDEEPDAPQS